MEENKKMMETKGEFFVKFIVDFYLVRFYSTVVGRKRSDNFNVRSIKLDRHRYTWI